jgi:hypothetical protein
VHEKIRRYRRNKIDRRKPLSKEAEETGIAITTAGGGGIIINPGSFFPTSIIPSVFTDENKTNTARLLLLDLVDVYADDPPCHFETFIAPVSKHSYISVSTMEKGHLVIRADDRFWMLTQNT